MQIYRLKDAPTEDGKGYSLSTMAELPLPKEVSSVSFYRLNVPPNGKLVNHYHEEVLEFMFFNHPGQIRCREETYDLSPWDIAMISPGDSHEIIASQKGISPLVVRRFKAATKSRHDLRVAENLLNRRGPVEASNRVWVSDITFIWTREGWLYLAGILDAFNRKVVGWSIGDTLNQGILAQAFEEAFRREKPGRGLIFHSDRGSQYASYAFRDLLDQHGFVPSMSS